VLAERTRAHAEALSRQANSVVLVAEDDKIAGLIALADTLRPEVSGALDELRALGIRHLLLLTGTAGPWPARWPNG
jgi:P-type E1-E2 ATPase